MLKEGRGGERHAFSYQTRGRQLLWNLIRKFILQSETPGKNSQTRLGEKQGRTTLVPRCRGLRKVSWAEVEAIRVDFVPLGTSDAAGRKIFQW